MRRSYDLAQSNSEIWSSLKRFPTSCLSFSISAEEIWNPQLTTFYSRLSTGVAWSSLNLDFPYLVLLHDETGEYQVG